MSQIDYQAEVLKVLPDAVCVKRRGWYWVRNKGKLLGDFITEEGAWQNAFNTLKSQNKL